jgi:hypothetical protein
MKAQIENLTNRLSYVPETKIKDTPSINQSKKPEDDPDWPIEIKTMADIILRREIKEKHL